MDNGEGLAYDLDIALISFVREKRMNVYTGEGNGWIKE